MWVWVPGRWGRRRGRRSRSGASPTRPARAWQPGGRVVKPDLDLRDARPVGGRERRRQQDGRTRRVRGAVGVVVEDRARPRRGTARRATSSSSSRCGRRRPGRDRAPRQTPAQVALGERLGRRVEGELALLDRPHPSLRSTWNFTESSVPSIERGRRRADADLRAQLARDRVHREATALGRVDAAGDGVGLLHRGVEHGEHRQQRSSRPIVIATSSSSSVTPAWERMRRRSLRSRAWLSCRPIRSPRSREARARAEVDHGRGLDPAAACGSGRWSSSSSCEDDPAAGVRCMLDADLVVAERQRRRVASSRSASVAAREARTSRCSPGSWR